MKWLADILDVFGGVSSDVSDYMDGTKDPNVDNIATDLGKTAGRVLNKTGVKIGEGDTSVVGSAVASAVGGFNTQSSILTSVMWSSIANFIKQNIIIVVLVIALIIYFIIRKK